MTEVDGTEVAATLLESIEREIAANEGIEIDEATAAWLHKLRLHMGEGCKLLDQLNPASEQGQFAVCRAMELVVAYVTAPNPDAYGVAAIITNFTNAMCKSLMANSVLDATIGEAAEATKQ